MSRRAGYVVAALLLGAGLAAGLPPVPVRSSAAVGCAYPGASPAERWERLPQPFALQSAGQLDRDPCVVIAAGTNYLLRRSTDAGTTWPESYDRAFQSVVTEGLSLQSGGKLSGPIFASQLGEASSTGEATSFVDVSTDEGETWTATSMDGGAVRGRVLAAAAAPHVELGNTSTYVYLVAAQPVAVTSLLPSAVDTSVLLRSTDGGHAFAPAHALVDAAGGAANVHPGARLVPTAVAVNRAAQDEVWIVASDPDGSRGAWVSIDAGDTFTKVCCTDGVVNDIAITPAGGGYAQVLLATSTGVQRSMDDGTTWQTIDTTPSFGVRSAPDDPGTVVSITAHGALWANGPRAAFQPLPGLPDRCVPARLRRTAIVPPTFLVDCGTDVGTYRVTLSRYGSHPDGAGGPAGDGDPTEEIPRSQKLPSTSGRQLVELARWTLPHAWWYSGALAFDGTYLYYGPSGPGGNPPPYGPLSIRASDGTPGPLVPYPGGSFLALTVDLRRNRLIISDWIWNDPETHARYTNLSSYDLATSRFTSLGRLPYDRPSYDASRDQLSWMGEESNGPLFHTTGYGTRPSLPLGMVGGCTSPYVKGIDGTKQPAFGVAAFFPTGDGGGYVQDEDDQTLFRVDAHCRITGKFVHRKFAEAPLENDSMACDTQTFYPQAAIWIIDDSSSPQPVTVTAYAVPYGYCPMPSALTLNTPSVLHEGERAPLCAHLTNRTSGVPAAVRPVVVSVGGSVLGRGTTDANGDVCLPYQADALSISRRQEPVTASFPGDSALYPSAATAALTVIGPMPPVPPVPPIAVVPPPPPPPPAALPAQPVVNVIHAPAPAPAPAPHLAQAPMAQAQPVANAVAVPNQQEQPELVFAKAEIQIEQANQDMQMSALATRRPPDEDHPPAGALVAITAAALACGTARTARARGRPRR